MPPLLDRQPLETVRPVLRLLRLLRPYARRYLAQSMWGVVGTLLGLSIPYSTSLIVDEVYPSGELSLLLGVVTVVAAIGVASSCISVLRGMSSQLIQASAILHLSEMYLHACIELPLATIERYGAATLQSRLSEVRGTVASLARAFDSGIGAMVNIFIVPTIVVVISPKLAILAAAGPVVLALINQWTISRSRPRWRVSAEQASNASGLFSEAMTSVRTIKLMDGKETILGSYAAFLKASLNSQVSAMALNTTASLVSGVFKMVHIALSTYIGWKLVIVGELSMGEFLAFGSYVGLATAPVTVFGSILGEVQRASVSVERFLEVVEHPSERREGARLLPGIDTDAMLPMIELRNICFKYGEQSVLQNISLSIAQGEKVLLQGASGAGKSSLVRLLSGLDLPSSGTILVFGRVIERSHIHEYRKFVSTVWQETGLLSGTIASNLRLGCPTASDQKLWDALAICECARWIKVLPKGLDTEVAELGGSLSAGQRQRLTIARALVLERPLLVIDEATANLDVATESLLLQRLSALQEITLIIVSHRPSAARYVSRVIRMEGGAVQSDSKELSIVASGIVE